MCMPPPSPFLSIHIKTPSPLHAYKYFSLRSTLHHTHNTVFFLSFYLLLLVLFSISSKFTPLNTPMATVEVVSATSAFPEKQIIEELPKTEETKTEEVAVVVASLALDTPTEESKEETNSVPSEEVVTPTTEAPVEAVETKEVVEEAKVAAATEEEKVEDKTSEEEETQEVKPAAEAVVEDTSNEAAKKSVEEPVVVPTTEEETAMKAEETVEVKEEPSVEIKIEKAEE